MFPVIVSRARAPRIGVLVLAAFGLLAGGFFLFSDGFRQGWRSIPVIATVLVVAWLLWWVPLLVVDGKGVWARNVWTRVFVPWDALEGVEVRLGLILVASGQHYRLSACQPPSSLRRIGDRTPLPLPHIDEARPQFTCDLDANQGRELLTTLQYRREHEQLQIRCTQEHEQQRARVEQAGYSQPGSPAPFTVSRRLNYPTLFACLALAALWASLWFI